MSTTARIYFVDDVGNPDESLDSRNYAARHRAHNACLFVYSTGYPRHGSYGVLDRLEALIAEVPDRALRASGELSGHLVLRSYESDDYGFTVVPSNPTVGTLTSFEYLVVCHSRTTEKPSLFVQKGCLWWPEKEFFNGEHWSPREWGQLWAWEQDGEPEDSMLLDGLGLVASDARRLLSEAHDVRDASWKLLKEARRKSWKEARDVRDG